MATQTAEARMMRQIIREAKQRIDTYSRAYDEELDKPKPDVNILAGLAKVVRNSYETLGLATESEAAYAYQYAIWAGRAAE